MIIRSVTDLTRIFFYFDLAELLFIQNERRIAAVIKLLLPVFRIVRIHGYVNCTDTVAGQPKRDMFHRPSKFKRHHFACLDSVLIQIIGSRIDKTDKVLPGRLSVTALINNNGLISI